MVPSRAHFVDGPGHELLARAALPVDEHRGARGGDLLQEPEDLLHGGILAHDPPVHRGALQAGAQVEHLLFLGRGPEDAVRGMGHDQGNEVDVAEIACTVSRAGNDQHPQGIVSVTQGKKGLLGLRPLEGANQGRTEVCGPVKDLRREILQRVLHFAKELLIPQDLRPLHGEAKELLPVRAGQEQDHVLAGRELLEPAQEIACDGVQAGLGRDGADDLIGRGELAVHLLHALRLVPQARGVFLQAGGHRVEGFGQGGEFLPALHRNARVEIPPLHGAGGLDQ